MNKLSETQTLILSRASRQADRIALPLPNRLRLPFQHGAGHYQNLAAGNNLHDRDGQQICCCNALEQLILSKGYVTWGISVDLPFANVVRCIMFRRRRRND